MEASKEVELWTILQGQGEHSQKILGIDRTVRNASIS
jgi:hypothetical protein